MQPIDEALFRVVNSLAVVPIVDVVGVFFAQVLIFVLAAVPIVGFFTKEGKRVVGGTVVLLRAFLAVVFGVLGNLAISLIFFRIRPFRALSDLHLLIAPPFTEKSFPSDHATIAFAIAFTVYLVRPTFGKAMLIGATAVAIGRVVVGVHYPGDVFAGALVGMFWAFVAARFLPVRSASTHVTPHV